MDKDIHLEIYATNSSQEKQKFNYNYLTISACAEPIEEINIDSVFSIQHLVILTNIDEALQDPI